MLRAISHPLRAEVLRLLHNRVASPKELAQELGETISNVSYHVKYLLAEDCVEMLDTAARRGAVEHFYRAKACPVRDPETWAELPQPAREQISELEIRNLLGEALRALNAGTFDANEDRRLDWMPMELDERGWQELVERQSEWLEELERIEAEAAERLAEKSGPGRRAIAATMAFETPLGVGFPSS